MGARSMNKQKIAGAVATLIVLGAGLFYGYQRWRGSGYDPRNDLLRQMPAEASAVLFVDLDALRHSPFLAELYKWAPQTKTDADYTQFVKSTGFNYETDLNRMSIAVLNGGKEKTLFVIAEGRFDRKKISTYALQTGTHENRGGREIFSVPDTAELRRITFTFLPSGRIALTNGANLDSFLSRAQADADTQAWRERFRRLAGSPLFAVVRQDGAVGAALEAEAPSGLSSPQLSALIHQLEWITVAGKPDADRLRVALEGEGAPDAPMRQLSEVINGLLVLAKAGLSEPKMRDQLPPDVREAYLEMLKSADVSQMDRGETKSVRLIFDLTPKFLEAARAAMPPAAAPPQGKVRPNKTVIRN